ncbi:MAG: C4-dicarboxylate TRAP transporter substrate-binding protein [Spirochaetia bacterium]|jgi:TRAP-type C4-dicarboxylate transport system substrate-binding protein|nr:C4-dicarboxylate TRAP transporter substrate-binding protein [Spirochaetia bacterium]
MRKCFALLMILLTSFGLLFAQGSAEKSSVATNGKTQKKYVIKLANTQGEKDTQSIGLFEVAKRLNASGMFDAQVYTSSSLGDTDDITEQAIAGAPVLTVSDPGRLMSYVHDFGVIQMPYLFTDAAVLDKLVNTDVYKSWEKDFEKDGIKLITSNWYNGPRNFVCNKQIDTPADLKGQKIRTIGSELFVDSVNAMGAVATPMAWSEVYSGIQQGAIDGAEVQTPASYATRLYEICKYTNKTEHFQLVGCVVMGTNVFNSWSKEAQDFFVKTFREVGTENRKMVNDYIKNYETDMAKKGMIIHEVDKAPFIEAVQPIYDKLGYTQLAKTLKADLAK